MASYEKLQNGNWCFRIRVFKGDKLVNKRIRHWNDDIKQPPFKTKREAERGFAAYTILTTETKTPPCAVTLNQIKCEWENSVRNSLKARTLNDYIHKIDKKIIPYFGDKNVADISKKMIENWQSQLKGKYNSRKNIRSLLGQLLTYADETYNIPNLLHKVPPLADNDVREEMKIWDMDEFNRFIDKVPDGVYKAFFIFLYYTGCRRGEGLALYWTDIDLKNKTVRINKSRYSMSDDVTTPKNRYSIRTISVPQIVCDQISGLSRENKFIFPINLTQITRVKDEAVIKSGVKRIRIHDLRHSHASYLISHGVSIVAVSRRLGHKSIEQTLKTYTHLLPRDDQAIIDVFEAGTNRVQKIEN